MTNTLQLDSAEIMAKITSCQPILMLLSSTMVNVLSSQYVSRVGKKLLSKE